MSLMNGIKRDESEAMCRSAFRPTSRAEARPTLGATNTRISKCRGQVAGALLLAWLLQPGAVLAHGGEDHSHPEPAQAAPTATLTDHGKPARLADASLFVPKSAQHRFGLRTERVALTDLAATLEFNGTVIADANAGGRVQASQSGRIEPGPQGLPRLGQRVAKGQVLAWLRPLSDSIERAGQQAQLAEIAGQIDLAEARLRRYAQLDGLIAGKTLEAARIELAALHQRKAAIAAGLNAAEALRAPVTGVISAANGVAGQVVEARDVLYEIVDPARLAVEALAYDPAQAADIAGASLALPGGGGVPLSFIGAGRSLRQQALPLLFRVESGGAALAVGQPVKVIARRRASLRGVALPMAALTRDEAGERVWVKLAAERYQARRVETRPLDGQRVAVVAGLKAGERVVVTGASWLGQVR